MIGQLAYFVGRLPGLGRLLRWGVRRLGAGGVTTIRSGPAAGLRWTRHPAYVNGYWLGIYEPEIQDVLKRELRPGQVFYDVGAHAGFFSLVASRLVGPTGAVYAFEPIPANGAFAAEQVALNRLDHVSVIHSAVGGTCGTAVMSRSPLTTTARLIDAGVPHAPSADAGVSVPLITLDAFARDHRPPDFLKVDVEGAEGQVIAGAAELIRTRRPTFLIELHDPGPTREVLDALTAAGYGFSDLHGRPLDDVSLRAGRCEHVVARPARPGAPA
jgi:FkbM family methyltransferase